MKSKKVILDTNIWISFLITKDFSFLDRILDSGKVKLIFSDELFTEFVTVAERPTLRKYFSKGDLKTLTQIIEKYGTLIEVTSNFNLCRDRKDNFLLNLAFDSKADYLVSGDKDLLIIGKVNKTKIITISELKAFLIE
jgi:uncharacterized protein